MHVSFYFATKRKRDLDNQNKIILDALSGIVYNDDFQIADLRLGRHLNRDFPRIQIVVAPTQAI